MNSLEAPPWVERAIRGTWQQIEDIVGRDMMPRVEDEFGCGRYGCVMPTLQASDTVVKLTSDVTESFFVAHLLDKDLQPESGLVHYDRIIGIPGTYYGRPLFLIWRDEAFDVGAIPDIISPGSGPHADVEPWRRRAYQEGYRYMQHFRFAAADVRDTTAVLIASWLASTSVSKALICSPTPTNGIRSAARSALFSTPVSYSPTSTSTTLVSTPTVI